MEVAIPAGPGCNVKCHLTRPVPPNATPLSPTSGADKSRAIHNHEVGGSEGAGAAAVGAHGSLPRLRSGFYSPRTPGGCPHAPSWLQATPQAREPTTCAALLIKPHQFVDSDPDWVVVAPCGFDMDQTKRELARITDQARYGIWRPGDLRSLAAHWGRCGCTRARALTLDGAGLPSDPQTQLPPVRMLKSRPSPARARRAARRSGGAGSGR